MIPYGRQDITQDDINAVADVLRSDYLTQGPTVPAFEQAIAAHCKVPHALAFNSATSALHAACLALGVGRGDVVWTSPITFVASANCALYCGADVDFVDIDPQTYNISMSALADKLRRTKAANGRLPKVVIPVHLCGQSCDMQTMAALAKEYDFRIIEDASHAIGARYQNQPVGDCRYSDITVFSFHPVKIITTAEGGAITTRSDALAQSLQLFRSHGITRDPALMTQAPDGPWYYQQVALGFNYRMTDIQAALGRSQIERLVPYVAARHERVERYNRELSSLPLQLPAQLADTYSAWHLYVILLPESVSKAQHKHVFERLRELGIGVNLHYIPVYLQPYYQQLGFTLGYCPEAENYYRRAISLPMFHHLTEAQQTQVISAVKTALKDAGLCA